MPASATAASATPLKDTFKAKLAKFPEPTSEASLSVSGQVECPCLDWKAVLQPVAPRSEDPTILLLELIATPPNDECPQVPVKVPARYEELPAHGAYTKVQISYGEDTFTIDVAAP